MQIFEPTVYHIIYWSGQITTGRLRIDSFANESHTDPLLYHSVLASNKQWDRIFCCPIAENFSVSEYKYISIDDKNAYHWQHVQDLGCYDNYEKEALLQLKLDQNDRFLIGTAGKGFIVWDFNAENRVGDGAIYLPLPHGVRNISTKMMMSNSMMVSSKLDYSVAGVRYAIKGVCAGAAPYIDPCVSDFSLKLNVKSLTFLKINEFSIFEKMSRNH